MLPTSLTFEGLKGVGSVMLDLKPDQKVYTFIGANGIGKTKTLEALFQIALLTNKVYRSAFSSKYCEFENDSFFVFKHWTHDEHKLKTSDHEPILRIDRLWNECKTLEIHNSPVIFLASQNRGFISEIKEKPSTLGTFNNRKEEYFEYLIRAMENNFSSLNMDINIEEWFVKLAQSANPYQDQADNREIEIKTVLNILHKIDSSISPGFLEISGNNRVSLKVNGNKTHLNHLSTGFASIVKIIQSIISGYSYFTNETQLQHVKGIVLIDEIESHLHLSWQAKIIPLLKSLFPNTTFYISTHSSIVLSQLEEGEAYRLERNTDGIVTTNMIKSPNKSAIIDILDDAFGINLNKMKLDRMNAEQQKTAKQQLLNLLAEKGA